MANTTNFGWETPDDTDLVKDGAAAIRTLGSAIDTSLVDLKGGTTGQVLSKASNTDMDFTWVAQDDSNAIQNAIVDAKGDLISATAADTPARLAVGTNGQVLTADSTQSTGLAWTTISSGGMTLIQETTASALSSLSFSSISSSYTDLVLVWNGIYHSATGSWFDIRLNNDSGTNYYYQTIYGEPGSFTTYTGSTTAFNQGVGTNGSLFGRNANISSTANLQQTVQGILTIYNYASTSKIKFCQFNSSYYNVGGTTHITTLPSNVIWNSTSAVSSIDIIRGTGTATFSNVTNTSIRLYGVK